MADYYISQEGSDVNGNGTVGNPWRSFAKALRAADGGGRIMIMKTVGRNWTPEIEVSGTGNLIDEGTHWEFGHYSYDFSGVNPATQCLYYEGWDGEIYCVGIDSVVSDHLIKLAETPEFAYESSFSFWVGDMPPELILDKAGSGINWLTVQPANVLDPAVISPAASCGSSKRLFYTDGGANLLRFYKLVLDMSNTPNADAAMYFSSTSESEPVAVLDSCHIYGEVTTPSSQAYSGIFVNGNGWSLSALCNYIHDMGKGINFYAPTTVASGSMVGNIIKNIRSADTGSGSQGLAAIGPYATGCDFIDNIVDGVHFTGASSSVANGLNVHGPNPLIRNNTVRNVTCSAGHGRGLFVTSAANGAKIFNNIFDTVANGIVIDGVAAAWADFNCLYNVSGLAYHTDAIAGENDRAVNPRFRGPDDNDYLPLNSGLWRAGRNGNYIGAVFGPSGFGRQLTSMVGSPLGAM